MFLVNSRLGLVSAALNAPPASGFTNQAPLLPKLRGHFAEFLNHDSLDRLGILYLTTCVGLGYGRLWYSLEAFLDSIGSLTSPIRLGIRSQAHGRRIYLSAALRPYTRTTIAAMSYLPASPHHLPTTSSGHTLTKTRHPEGRSSSARVLSITDSAWAHQRRYGNINPLSIDYACRPRLRSRLTQGRLA